MDEEVKRLCTICARGGSKGVKNKNIRNLCGKPLIAYSIEQAQVSQLFDDIAVSSEDTRILDIARTYGVQHLIQRPPHLATDNAPKLSVIQHCVRETENHVGDVFNTVVDLDATSPLRDIEDIVTAIQILERSDAHNLLTGTLSRKSPYFNMVDTLDNGAVRLIRPMKPPIVRRQDVPKTYDLNASIYVWNRNALLSCNTLIDEHTVLYVMPPERSLDIDSELDFEMIEFMMRKRMVR